MVQNLAANASFSVWPHGSPINGSFGAGNETAQSWISKWDHSARSALVASKRPGGGLRYTLHPDPAINWATMPDHGETFYLRQTYPQLKASLGKKFHVAFVVGVISGNPRGGFYLNARWNNTDRLLILNTVGGIPLVAGAPQAYATDFVMPSGAGIDWQVSGSAGIEFTFLFTCTVPSVVDVTGTELITA